MSVTFYVDGRIADPRVAELELNVCNGNAAEILAMLGYLSFGGAEDVELADGPGPEVPEELGGEADAEDFLGRVLIAQALNPGDPGRPARRINARCEVAARRAGYLDEKLLRLERLGRFCFDIDTQVVWG